MQYANEYVFCGNYPRLYIARMTIGKRLDEAMRDAKFPSQSALARASGVPQPTINRILQDKGVKGPETDTIKKLASACNVNFQWLMEGKGPKSGVALEAPRTGRSLAKAKSDEIEIPQFDVGGGMGNGRLLLEDQPGLIKSWHVDHEWLRLNVRNHTGAQNLCIVTGFGPSMRPMFNPGDPLLVDRGVTTVEVDSIYFFRLGKHGFIKILQRVPRGDEIILRAKSKNPDYDPFDIDGKADFQVLGRVLTVWKSEQF